MRWLPAILALSLISIAPASQKTAGQPKAPVMIEVYSDFQCPSCKVLYEGAIRPLLADYVAKGKVYLIHRDFPLAMHRFAGPAARYGVAASKVGKYEEVAAAMFRDQVAWSTSGRVELSVASALSPDEFKRVQALAASPEVAAEIQKDHGSGVAAGLKSTPSMIVTHKLKQYPVTGSVTYDVLKRFIDQLLAQ
jgi:protein-disulfide isomerase